MKVKNVIWIIMLTLAVNVHGQLHPGFSQYMVEGLTFNPAFAGSREVLSTAFFHRSKFVGFGDGHKYQTLSAHTPLQNTRIGLGLLLMHERYGFDNNYSLYMNYAYRASLRVGKLSFGLKGGIELTNVDQSEIITSPRFGQDPVFSNTENYFYPNFGVGVYYYTRRFFAGASIPLLLSKKFTESGKGVELTHDFKQYNYFFTSGAKIGILEMNVSPAIILKYVDDQPLVLGGNVNFDFLQDRFTVGAGYTNELNSVIGITQIKVNEQLRLGYSYNYSLNSALKTLVNGVGTHEIMLRYEFRYIIDAANPVDF